MLNSGKLQNPAAPMRVSVSLKQNPPRLGIRTRWKVVVARRWNRFMAGSKTTKEFFFWDEKAWSIFCGFLVVVTGVGLGKMKRKLPSPSSIDKDHAYSFKF